MKMYKWFRGLLKASALTTVMFIMQACYGVPRDNIQLIQISGHVVDKDNGQPLTGIQLEVFGLEGNESYGSVTTDYNGYFEMTQYGSYDRVSNLALVIDDTYGVFNKYDTVLTSDTDLTGLRIKLERHQ